jgi:hypothetical protein
MLFPIDFIALPIAKLEKQNSDCPLFQVSFPREISIPEKGMLFEKLK